VAAQSLSGLKGYGIPSQNQSSLGTKSVMMQLESSHTYILKAILLSIE
jgi:hypothetical protein